MASRADVAHGTRADATRHARPCGRLARGPHGEHRWPELMRTRGRGHASPRGCLRGCHVASEEAGIWRAHRLVGPSEMIGAVTQMRYILLSFICELSSLFLRVGLCSRGTLSLQDTWWKETRRMWSRWRRCVDRMDMSPHDHYHDTCTKMGISEIRRPWLNPIEAHHGDVWTHHDGPIFIGRAKHAEGVGRDLRSWET